MKLLYSAEARENVLDILEWWLEHRDKNPSLFEDELMAAEDRILSGPHRRPVFREVDGWSIRRVLLGGTHHHLYYQCTDDVVYVLSVWGAPKKGPPLLRPTPLSGERR